MWLTCVTNGYAYDKVCFSDKTSGSVANSVSQAKSTKEAPFEQNLNHTKVYLYECILMVSFSLERQVQGRDLMFQTDLYLLIHHQEPEADSRHRWEQCGNTRLGKQPGDLSSCVKIFTAAHEG